MFQRLLRVRHKTVVSSLLLQRRATVRCVSSTATVLLFPHCRVCRREWTVSVGTSPRSSRLTVWWRGGAKGGQRRSAVRYGEVRRGEGLDPVHTYQSLQYIGIVLLGRIDLSASDMTRIRVNYIPFSALASRSRSRSLLYSFPFNREWVDHVQAGVCPTSRRGHTATLVLGRRRVYPTTSAKSATQATTTPTPTLNPLTSPSSPTPTPLTNSAQQQYQSSSSCDNPIDGSVSVLEVTTGGGSGGVGESCNDERARSCGRR